MAHHLLDERISVNTIAPGYFVSQMTKAALGDDDGRRQAAAYTPMGRIGAPEDLAGAVLFLTSRASSWLTGVTLPVDGGVSTRAA
jgi:NAD(P)-dependent dehydrogenase (short-subunit alcohol dehydrogenase family)